MIGRWAPLYLLAAAAIGGGVSHLWSGRDVRVPWIILALVAFGAWAGASLAWSPDPAHGFGGLIQFTVYVALIWGVTGIDRQALLEWMPWLAALAVLGMIGFGIYDPTFEFGGLGNRNFFVEALSLLAVFMFAAKDEPAALLVGGGYVILAALWLIFAQESNLGFVAFGGIGVVGFVALCRRRPFWGAVLFLVLSNLAVWAPWTERATSAMAARVELGINTAILWWDHLWIGGGFGSFNALYGAYREGHLKYLPDWGTIFIPVNQFPGQAHNELLQVGAETGVVGIVLALLVMAALARGMLKPRDRLDVVATCVLAIGAGFCLVEFPLRNPSTGATLAVAAGIVCQGRSLRLQASPWFRCLATAGGYVFVPTLLVCGMIWIKAWLIFTGTIAWQHLYPKQAFIWNYQAIQLWPYDRRFRHQFMLTLRFLMYKAGDKVKLTTKAADIAYDISRSAAPHEPSIQIARVEYLLTSRRFKESDEIEKLLRALSRAARHQPAYWLVEANYGLAYGDRERVAWAVDNGRRLKATPNQLATFDKFTDLLEN